MAATIATIKNEAFFLHCCCLVTKLSDSFAALLTVAHQAPLSMGFPSQEYWSGLLCPPPGDLPKPGIKPPESPALQVNSLLLNHQG